MIGFIDGVTGSPCFLCKEPIQGGWALHEVVQDEQWEVICAPCELVTEVGAGK